MRDSIYSDFSPRQEIALERLSVILEGVGFDVMRKRTNEATLRVYPRGFRTYPLLNPRFRKTVNDNPAGLRGPTLEITAFVREHPGSWGQRLEDFASSKECQFVRDPKARQGDDYFRLGWFVPPLPVVGPRRDEQVNFESMAEQLARIRHFFNV